MHVTHATPGTSVRTGRGRWNPTRVTTYKGPVNASTGAEPAVAVIGSVNGSAHEALNAVSNAAASASADCTVHRQHYLLTQENCPHTVDMFHLESNQAQK